MAAIMMVGLIDHVTGPVPSVTPFYLLPAGVVASVAGRRAALACVALATLSEVVSDVLFVHGHEGRAEVMWNTLVLLVTLIVMTELVGRILSRARAALEAEVRSREFLVLAGAAARAVGTAKDGAAAVRAFGEVVHAGVRQFERVSLAVDDGGDAFRVVGAWGSTDIGLSPGQRYSIGDGPHRRAYREGHTVAVADTATADAKRFDHERADQGVRSYVTVPIVAGGEVRAVINFAATRPEAFTPAEVVLCERLAGSAAGPFNMVVNLDRAREAVERLRALDTLKNEFVGIVAHDLRTPIGFISGIVRIVRDDWPKLSDTERDELLDRIAATTGRLTDLVSDVLDVARIESGTLDFKAWPFDVGDLVRRTVGEIMTTAADHPCEVVVAAGLPAALGDEAKTWRVVTNLVSNALKFSPPGTPIIVDVTAGDGEVRVSVTDHGPGFASSERDRVFQKFSRLSGSGPGPRPGGVGLGLYISKNLIEGQNGRIWAHSTYGEGATFGFALPNATTPQVPC